MSFVKYFYQDQVVYSPIKLKMHYKTISNATEVFKRNPLKHVIACSYHNIISKKIFTIKRSTNITLKLSIETNSKESREATLLHNYLQLTCRGQIVNRSVTTKPLPFHPIDTLFIVTPSN